MPGDRGSRRGPGGITACLPGMSGDKRRDSNIEGEVGKLEESAKKWKEREAGGEPKRAVKVRDGF